MLNPTMNAIDIFPWDDNFATGLPQVDEQHRKLVHLLNQLASSVAFGPDSTRVNEIFDELLDYTVYDFQTEEAIWHQYMPDDPSEIARCATHATFVATVLRLKAEQDQKPLARIAEDAFEFLVRWLAERLGGEVGAHALDHFRREGNTSGGHVPIMASTANAFDKDRRACVDAGMDDFLSKPVNTNQLLLTIETWLPRRLG